MNEKKSSRFIRKTWPKIRVVKRRGGQRFYQVDARRTGTNLKQEHFSTEEAAKDRAAEIEKLFAGNGTEGLAMPMELRGMAFTAEKLLAPYGTTILQAAEFYVAWRKDKEKTEQSALVPILAQEWAAEKQSGKFKKLRESTLGQIKATAKTLGEEFQGRRILEITTADVQAFLDRQEVGLLRKHHLKNLFGQFFNWCVRKELIEKNPAEKIQIEVETKDVFIFTPDEAERILTVCQEQFPKYTLYHAISLFAGLRPEECQYLEWHNVHLDERTIHVTAESSKIKEARNVHIEDNLLAWLKALRPKDTKGFVTPVTNFINVALRIHIAAGFRGRLAKTTNGVKIRTLFNETAPEWPTDVLRHSYGSYWLARNQNRAALAESMGNSVQIIKKHYRRVVTKTDTTKYWEIMPPKAKRAVKFNPTPELTVLPAAA